MKFTEGGVQKTNKYIKSYPSLVKFTLIQQQDNTFYPLVWQKIERLRIAMLSRRLRNKDSLTFCWECT